MRWSKGLIGAAALFVLVLAVSAASAAPEKTPNQRIKVLIVDGHSNHDWQRTTQLICAILKPTDLFETSVSTAPAKADEPAYATWCPDFARFDVVIQNYNDMGGGALWPEPARLAFERYVREGGGVFILHSANNAFAPWEEYNKMIGLGWRGKDYGTAIRIGADEKPERIPPGQGNGTGHGKRTDRVIHRLGEDPIHAGMPRAWMTPLIEVYTYARGPAENMTLLSFAEEPTTHERWPIEWTIQYGKGRVYNSTFGHVWRDEADPVDLRCAGFQTVLLRSLQWLAGRPISWPVPSDFPTESATVLRPLPSESK